MQLRKTAALLLCAAVLMGLLSACQQTEPIRPTESGNQQIQTTQPTELQKPAETPEATEPVPTLPPMDLSQELATFVSTTVQLENGTFDALQQELENLQIHYAYEELFGILDAFDRVANLPAYTSTYENLFAEGPISAQDLMDICKRNAQNADVQSHKILPDATLLEICEIIAPLFWDYAKDMTQQEQQLLSEKVDSLYIIQYQEFGQGYYESASGRMGLSKAFFEEGADKGLFYRTVTHETHHVLQSASQQEAAARGFYSRSGYCYVFEDADEEPLRLRCVFEGSNEMLNHNYLNSKEYDVYTGAIEYWEYIKLATMLYPQNEVTTFEELSFQDDWAPVFALFGADSQQEQEETLNFLFSREALSNQMGSADAFCNRYKEKTGASFSGIEYLRIWRDSDYQYYTKLYFKGLTKLLEGQTVTMEEIFQLMSVIEQTMRCSYGEEYRYTTSFTQYLTFQDAIFAILAQKLDVEPETIREHYTAYYKAWNGSLDKVTLLSSEKCEYLSFLAQKYWSSKGQTVYNKIQN